jgi:hypothetical protein
VKVEERCAAAAVRGPALSAHRRLQVDRRHELQAMKHYTAAGLITVGLAALFLLEAIFLFPSRS